MSFWGNRFVFDGVPSELYGLYCGEMSSSGENSSSSGSAVEIIDDFVSRRNKPYFYGTKFTTKLEFTLSFFSETALSRIMVQAIEQWLFGHKEYKRLQIIQCDMQDVYFNCIINTSSVITSGNNVYGFSCNIICDSPWGWGFDVKQDIDAMTGTNLIEIINYSDDNSYLYPKIEFTSSAGQSNVKIINTSDNDRETSFSTLSEDEIVTMDNDIKLVESTMEDIYNRFNGVYVRLVRGTNKVSFVGSFDSVTVTYTPARKVGS